MQYLLTSSISSIMQNMSHIVKIAINYWNSANKIGQTTFSLICPKSPFSAGSINKSMRETDREKTTQNERRDTSSHRLGFWNNSAWKSVGQTASTQGCGSKKLSEQKWSTTGCRSKPFSPAAVRNWAWTGCAGQRRSNDWEAPNSSLLGRYGLQPAPTQHPRTGVSMRTTVRTKPPFSSLRGAVNNNDGKNLAVPTIILPSRGKNKIRPFITRLKT